MNSQLELSAAELADLLSAVLAANGLVMRGMEARDANGQVLEIGSVQLTCDHPGLAVDIRPPNSRQTLSERMSQAREDYLERVQATWQHDSAGDSGLVDGSASGVESNGGSG